MRNSWRWYKSEGVVAPWKALGRNAQVILEGFGLSKENFPVVPYPVGQQAHPPPGTQGRIQVKPVGRRQHHLIESTAAPSTDRVSRLDKW